MQWSWTWSWEAFRDGDASVDFLAVCGAWEGCFWGSGVFPSLFIELWCADAGFRVVYRYWLRQTFDAYNRQLEDAIAGIGIIWPDRLRTRWCSIFRILYNLDPMLESRDAESLFLETSEIIQIAEEELHANITFLQGIESALLHLDQITFHSIVLHPIPW